MKNDSPRGGHEITESPTSRRSPRIAQLSLAPLAPTPSTSASPTASTSRKGLTCTGVTPGGKSGKRWTTEIQLKGDGGAGKRGRRKRERGSHGDEGEDALARPAAGPTAVPSARLQPTPPALIRSASTTPLPSLLSHLSLSTAFPPSPTITTASGTFSFPIPEFNSRHAYPHLHPLSTLPRSRSSSFSTPSPTLDKRPPSPHPHLFSRTKKLKLAHRFYRSEALLAGPSSSPSFSPPLPPFSPPLSPPKSVYTPNHPRRPPSWWPSVSRSGGDGTESRMGPDEACWVGEGDGWVDRVQLRLGGEREGGGKGKGKGNEVGLAGGRREVGGTMMGRTRSSRSLSSPPAFVHSVVQGAPPLKQHLLAVLRMRLSEGGGSSKGGEAGLRFKKWVVWNAFMKRTTKVPDDSDDDLVECESSEGSDDLDPRDDLDIDLPEVDPSPHQSDLLSQSSLFSSSDSPMSTDLVPPSPDPDDRQMDLDPPPPRPSSPRQSPRVLQPPDGSSVESSRATKAGPPVGRPKLRRAHSVPIVGSGVVGVVGSGREFGREREGEEGGKGGGVVACEA